MSRSRRGKKAGEDAERLLQEAFGVSEDQLLKDFILAQTEVKDSDIPPEPEDGFERLMAKLEAEVGTSPESEKESSSENIVKLHEEVRKPRRLKSIVKVSVAAAAIAVMVVAMGISAGAKREYRYVVREKDSVMKVLGCSLRNIREMFLLEAAFIGLLGGIAGNILSFVMSAAINIIVGSSGAMSMGTDSTISYIPWWLVLMSMVFAVLVGVLAGYFPAKRAMKLSPLAAIRNE